MNTRISYLQCLLIHRLLSLLQQPFHWLSHHFWHQRCFQAAPRCPGYLPVSSVPMPPGLFLSLYKSAHTVLRNCFRICILPLSLLPSLPYPPASSRLLPHLLLLFPRTPSSPLHLPQKQRCLPFRLLLPPAQRMYPWTVHSWLCRHSLY